MSELTLEQALKVIESLEAGLGQLADVTNAMTGQPLVVDFAVLAPAARAHLGLAPINAEQAATRVRLMAKALQEGDRQAIIHAR